MGTMPGAKPISIDSTRRDLASADPHVRGRALNALLMAIDRQPELREPARQIFHESAEHETYNWLVTTSVTGIERLDGPDTARPYWRRLLTQPDATAAGQAAMAVVNPSHLPLMLEMFDARAEFVFRRGAIYAFGRMRDPSVIPLLLKLGADEQMQPCIVQALSDLGDPSAIPWVLLEVVGARVGPTGGHALSGTTFIQRVNTQGGLAPSTGCDRLTDVGRKAFMPYTADYFFYTKN